MTLPVEDGDLTEVVRALERLTGEVRQAIDNLNEPANATAKVVQKFTMGGFATGVAVASCVATLFLTIAFMIIENRSYAHLDAQVDQLRAWNDVHSQAIARLQAATKPKE